MLGNTTALTDGSGVPASQYDMEAFGTVKNGGQNGVHLTTKEWDDDNGLYYFSARWYSSSNGIFFETAPVDSYIEHPYSYCEALPTNRIDPKGSFSVSCTNPGINYPNTKECLILLGQHIDDPKLQLKIHKILTDSKTTIECKATGACNGPGDMGHPTDKGINLCPGKLGGCGKTDICLILIHEAAHKAGWSHKKGNPGSVPGWDGTFKCSGK